MAYAATAVRLHISAIFLVMKHSQLCYGLEEYKTGKRIAKDFSESEYRPYYRYMLGNIRAMNHESNPERSFLHIIRKHIFNTGRYFASPVTYLNTLLICGRLELGGRVASNFVRPSGPFIPAAGVEFGDGELSEPDQFDSELDSEFGETDGERDVEELGEFIGGSGDEDLPNEDEDEDTDEGEMSELSEEEDLDMDTEDDETAIEFARSLRASNKGRIKATTMAKGKAK